MDHAPRSTAGVVAWSLGALLSAALAAGLAVRHAPLRGDATVTMVAGPHVGGDELVFELTTPDLREWIRIAAPGRPQVLSRLWHRLRVVPRIRICYGDVTAGRLLAGTITLTATLQPSGALTDIEVSEATGALGAVAACAVTRLALDDEGTSVRPLRPLPIVVDVTFSPRASPAP